MSSDRAIVDAIKVARIYCGKIYPRPITLVMQQRCYGSPSWSVPLPYDPRWSAAATRFSRLHCERWSVCFPINRRVIAGGGGCKYEYKADKKGVKEKYKCK